MNTRSPLLPNPTFVRSPFLLSVLALAAVAPASALAQCPNEWSADFRAPGLGSPGIGFFPRCTTLFNDGTGSRLYVAGIGARAGGQLVRSIVQLDGEDWRPLGGGLQNPSALIPNGAQINCMAVFDIDGDGPGAPELYVAGQSMIPIQSDGSKAPRTFLAKWNGSTWTSVLPPSSDFSGPINTMAVGTGPSGPTLFIGGQFLARLVSYGADGWQGVNGYRAVGSRVTTLANYDPDGAGPASSQIYVGLEGDAFNAFTRVDATGTQLEALPSLPNPPYADGSTYTPESMEVFDADGPGPIAPVLCAGQSAVIATWNGTTWGQLPYPAAGVFETIPTMRAIDVGSGQRLYFGAGQPHYWDGTAYHDLGSGVSLAYGAGGANATSISAIGPAILRGAPAVFVGGEFSQGGSVPGLRAGFFDGTNWIPQFASTVSGLASVFAALYSEPFDIDGPGGEPARPLAYPLSPDSIPIVTQNIATENSFLQFDGTTWQASSLPDVPASLGRLHRCNLGDGESNYFVGTVGNTDDGAWITQIYRQIGNQWVGVANGSIGMSQQCSAVFDPDGPAPALLVVGGIPPLPDGSSARAIAWNGTSYVDFGADAIPPDAKVQAMTVFNDGTGNKLFVSLYSPLNPPGGTTYPTMMMYDGTSWSVIADESTTGAAGLLISWPLRVMDLGSGPTLYAGAHSKFDGFNRTTTEFALYRWTGSGWALDIPAGTLVSPVTNNSIRPTVSNLTPHDDGTGTALYVGGNFISISGQPAQYIAKRSGGTWEPLGSVQFAGSNDNPRVSLVALFSYDSDDSGPSRPALYVASTADNAGGKPFFGITRWGPSSVCCPCTADFDQSGGTPDSGDIDAFFSSWLLGDPTADADCSGGTPDSGDIDTFFTQWLNGGC
jgi:hypothetical protein